MSFSTWAVEAENRASRKLASILQDDPAARAVVKRIAEMEGSAYRDQDPLWSFSNLYRVRAQRSTPRTQGIPPAPDIMRARSETHEQITCEELARQVLDSLGIAY